MADLSANVREKFKQRVGKKMDGVRAAQAEADKKKKEEAASHFDGLPVLECGEHQEMFSKLFFNPSTINRPDFPVNTYFHEQEHWPTFVQEAVPKADVHYQWNKEITYDFVASDGNHAFLVGLPGSGKTSLPYQVAAKQGRPVFKQAFQQDLEADEWLAAKEISEEGTYWKHLPFVQFMPYPTLTILDEFNRLRRGGRLLMNQLLNKGGTLLLRSGEEITPHNEWRAIATDNTRGMGDGLDKFDGDVADISTQDRFDVMIEVPYLPAKQQAKLVMGWFPGIKEKEAADFVKFGMKIVEAYKQGSVALPWTPRRLEAAVRQGVLHKNPRMGIQLAYFNFLAEDEERQLCNQVLKDIGLAKRFGEFS